MDEERNPAEASESAGPRIGVDEWVARAAERTLAPGRLGTVLQRVPAPVAFGAAVLVVALIPVMTTNDGNIRVATDTLLYIALALGLNVAVGWAGLLDLGYVAFFGFGAYGYALVSSDKFDQHWPSWLAIPAVTAATAILGLALGLTSWRLAGDYLAIVTLFFAQIFTVVVLNGNAFSALGFGGKTDVTGGPNGIAPVDPLSIAGAEAGGVSDYFYISLVLVVVVFSALALLSSSRPGRAWRALREDELAAQLMSMPVDRLKLLAYGFAAAIAGLTGTVFAALNTGVFPQTFDVPYLITIYMMVILGGAGSLPGVVLGAIVVNVSLEALRPSSAFASWSSDGRWLFYGIIVLTILVKLRPWRWAIAVLGGAIGLGFAVHAIVGALWERGVAGDIETTGSLTAFVERFVLLPVGENDFGKWCFVALLLAVCSLVMAPVRRELKLLGLIPTLYLGALAWENLLVIEASVTRILIVGAMLVVLMAARPQGLLGTQRVEVV